MSLTQPYKLIWRPFKQGHSFQFLTDPLYSRDRFAFMNSYFLLEKDLKKLLEYIYPSSNNQNTYSHRIYELFLRACTEFEANSKNILSSNNYLSSHLNITDYYKINKSSKLSDYEIKIKIWDDLNFKITPFSSWSSASYSPLNWYQDYNLVKHDRHNKFNKANFLNLINSISAVLVILYSQYNIQALNQYNDVTSYTIDDDGFIYTSESLFAVKAPVWADHEKYDFDWKTIKQTQNPFQNFSF